MVTISVWESLPEAQGQGLAADVEMFHESFPHYQIKLQHFDGPENFMTPLMAGQISFDIVLASPSLLGNLWSAQQIAPMGDFFPPSFIDAFVAVALRGASKEGDVWGLPDTAGFHLLLFYNQELVDTPPANTGELVELAQSLKQGSLWGLGVNSYDPLWVTPWLTPFGGWLIDEAGQPALNTAAMKEALTLYADWQSGPAAIAPVQTHDEMRAQFLDGKMALMIDGEWAIKELERSPTLNWAVAQLPAFSRDGEEEPAAPLVLGRYWAISSSAASGDRATAATTFLEFMTRPERQLAWTEQFGLLPTHRAALDDPIIVNDPILRVSALQMQSGQGMALGVNTNLLMDAMRGPLQELIAGKVTPDEAAEMMQANLIR